MRPSKYPPVAFSGTQHDFLASYGLLFNLSFSSGKTSSHGAGSGSGPEDFAILPGMVLKIKESWIGLPFWTSFRLHFSFLSDLPYLFEFWSMFPFIALIKDYLSSWLTFGGVKKWYLVDKGKEKTRERKQKYQKCLLNKNVALVVFNSRISNGLSFSSLLKCLSLGTRNMMRKS